MNPRAGSGVFSVKLTHYDLPNRIIPDCDAFNDDDCLAGEKMFNLEQLGRRSREAPVLF